MVKLGDRQFCFALDAVSPKAAGYDKLYFDANGNGDLTDDPPEKATEVTQPGPKMSQSQFPRVNVTLDVGGQPVEYAFLLSVLCTEAGDNSYATVSLYSAVAREGYMVQGKRRLKVLLVDRNSNGRFDDVVSVQPGGNVAEGDLLLINPNPKKPPAGDGGAGPDRNLVGKVLYVGKSFYRMAVTPDGSKLQLTPMKLSLGNVAGPGPSLPRGADQRRLRGGRDRRREGPEDRLGGGDVEGGQLHPRRHRGQRRPHGHRSHVRGTAHPR